MDFDTNKLFVGDVIVNYDVKKFNQKLDCPDYRTLLYKKDDTHYYDLLNDHFCEDAKEVLIYATFAVTNLEHYKDYHRNESKIDEIITRVKAKKLYNKKFVR